METLFGTIREIREFKWGGFIILETYDKKYQCVLKGFDLTKLKSESYVKIIGEKVDASVKKELVESSQEINVTSMDILTEPSHIPSINIYEKDLSADVGHIFDERALTLRNEKNKCVFKIQSVIHNSFRNTLNDEGFFSISTPKIVANGAEGGTNVFKVDYFEREAYLAQSPQLYKQMVCGALGKVYETAPVFRAEKHATARHLNEYISLDVEMILKENFYELIELEKKVIFSILEELRERCQPELDYLGIRTFGSPYNALILKVSEIKEILGTSGGDMSSEEEKEIARYAFEKKDADFIFATHYHRDVRPFYTKLSPDGITTESFDCIYKGIEITSGGQRKEKYSEYLEVMQAANMNIESFESYLDTFKYGMPLHGGFAIGLERLTAKICGLESAKAASLFPRDVNRLIP